MTKQEQIEEMAKCICNVCDWMEASGCMNGDIDNYTQCSRTMETANAIYEAGYRKIKEKNETLEEQIKHLNTIVERLDELLAKGINEYIMGIDGVEGLKDMWERSAVREFADKLKTQLEEKDQHYICMYDWNAHSAVTDCANEVDELLKEYE